MKRVEMKKTVVERQALLPDQVQVMVKSQYNTFSGYLNRVDQSLRGVNAQSYLLVNDGTAHFITETTINGVPRTAGNPVKVQARVNPPGQDWGWYDCEWRNEKLIYKYREQDFINDYHELVVGEIVDIVQDGVDIEATVVVSRPTQIVVEIKDDDGYSELVMFSTDDAADEYMTSAWGVYTMDGRYVPSDFDEELHS